MLVIRQEQIDTLSKGSDDEFVEFLLAHVKKEDPELESKYDDDAIRVMVRTGIDKANHYKITSAKDQSAFVSIMFRIAPNFDGQPDIKAVLEETHSAAADRLEKLWSPAVPAEVWDKAVDDYDEAAWQNDRKDEPK